MAFWPSVRVSCSDALGSRNRIEVVCEKCCVCLGAQKVWLCPMTRAFRAIELCLVYGACEMGIGEGEDRAREAEGAKLRGRSSRGRT